MELSRSKDGRTVHKRSCRYARIPWQWADDRQPFQVRLVVENLGHKVCKTCKPLGADYAVPKSQGRQIVTHEDGYNRAERRHTEQGRFRHSFRRREFIPRLFQWPATFKPYRKTG